MNKTRVLTTIALILTTFLSVVLLYLGIDKFYYVLAGGRKFATFPDLKTQFVIGASYLALSIVYLFWLSNLLTSSWVHTAWSFRQILLRTCVFWVLAFVAYPLGNDTYLYLHSGLMNLNGANPYLTRAGVFVTELSPYVDWAQTSTYGVISQFLFTFSAVFVTISPIVALYIFKLICLLLHLFNSYLIWRWLPVPDRGRITIAYLLHPLLLLEQVSSAHVDILVSTCLVLFTISYAQQRFWLAFVALWGGFLSKTLPIIWAPWFAITLLRQGHWKRLLGFIGASGAIIAVLGYTVLPNLAAWQSILNPGVAGQYQASLMSLAKFSLDIIRILYPEQLDLTQQRLILTTLANLTLAGFLGFYCWQLHRSDQRWNNTPQMLLEDMGWTTMVLMLLATSWLMPWYCSILITFAALLPKARLFGLTSLAFALSSSAQYLLGINSSLKALVSIGLPILTLVVGAWILRSQAMPPSGPPMIELKAMQDARSELS